MGTSRSAAELAGKMGKAARGLEFSTKDGVREAAVVGKAIFEGSLPARRMSGVGRRGGAKLGARYVLAGGSSNPTAVVSYTGPVHLLNNDTSAHMIGGRGLRTGKSGRALRGAKALRLRDGGIRGSVRHPGTSGKKFAPDAIDRARVAAPRQIELATGRALRKVF